MSIYAMSDVSSSKYRWYTFNDEIATQNRNSAKIHEWFIPVSVGDATNGTLQSTLSIYSNDDWIALCIIYHK